MLARGQVGLVISSHIAVHPWGRTRRHQLGIYDDSLIFGLEKLSVAMHRHGGKIVFQLGHAGLQTTKPVIGRHALGPSTNSPMSEHEIGETVEAFRMAAERASKAGADGVQLHAAHGYLINEFLSPFYNRRKDSWGGSDAGRFRFLKEIISAVKDVLPKEMALLVKMNSHDHTPEEGILPPLAVKYAEMLDGLKIDGLEISCGTSLLSPWNMCRGAVPVKELLKRFSEANRPEAEKKLTAMVGKFEISEGYNTAAAKIIRPVFNAPLFSVGGWRTFAAMQKSVEEGDTDLISMCRPFIREPFLVRNLKNKKTDHSSCINCNRCLAALANGLTVQCYINGF